MLRVIIFLGVLGLILAFIVEMIRHAKETKPFEEAQADLEEEERQLRLKEAKQTRERGIRRKRSKLETDEKFSEIDDVLSGIDLTDKEEK